MREPALFFYRNQISVQKRTNKTQVMEKTATTKNEANNA